MSRCTRLTVRRSLAVVMTVVALLAVPGIAHAVGATVSGTVTDAATGLPVAGSVTMYQMVWKTDGMEGRGYWARANVRSAQIWSDGSYRFPDDLGDFSPVKLGDCYMDFRANDLNYTDESYDNVHSYNYGSYSFGSAVPFRVAEGEQVTGINAALEKDGVLDIRLTTPNGSALGDAKVKFWVWDVAQQVWWNMINFRTDANGRLITSYGLPAATYRLTFGDSSGRFAEAAYGGGVFADEGADVVIEAGKTTQISAVLGPPSYATGRVVDPGGIGLSDIQVTAFRYDPYYSQWAWASSAVTDSTGRYTVIQTAGIYRYEFRDQAGTALNASDDVTTYYPGVASLASASSITLLSGATKMLNPVVITPAVGVVSRTAGTDRYDTSVAASARALQAGSCETVVIASGAAFPDALSACSLVGAVEGSLLLARTSTLPPAVATEIRRLGATKALVVGGPAAIGEGVIGQLEGLGVSVRRISGNDRYSTSVAVASEIASITGSPATEVILARGDVFADAVAASGIGSGVSIPVLLTRPTALPESTLSYFTDTLPQTVLILGGNYAVSSAIEASIAAVTQNVVGAEVVRIAGTSRYGTAADFAAWCLDRGWATGTHVGLASGASFADALTAGGAIGRDHGCVLLTRKDGLAPETRVFIREQRHGLTSATVYGGTGVISRAAFLEIGTAIDQD